MLNLSLSTHSKKAASMFSKPAEVQGRAKFSLGSVFIRGLSDCEARKLNGNLTQK